MKALRILHLLFCILFLQLLTSCSKNQQPDPQTADEAASPENFVISQKEVMTLLSNAGEITKRNARTNAGRTIIDSIKDFRNQKGQLLFYIINYKDNKGFKLLSADRRLKPVLAFADEGHFDDKTDNPGIRLWIDLIGENFEGTQKQKEAHIDIINYWKQLESGEFDNPPSTAPEWTPQASCEYFQNHPVPASVTISHLTHDLSFWKQGQGYNVFCPNGINTPNCSSFSCGKAPTGCGPLAVGQVLRYHRKPVTTNNHFYSTATFNAMPWFIPIPENCNPANANHINIAQLLRDVGKDMDAVYNTLVPALGIPMSGTSCQTWSTPGKIDNFFSNHGYTSYNCDFFSSAGLVKSELLASRPVIVFGSNCDVCMSNQHIWIIDGIKDLYNVFVDMNGYCYESNSVYYQMNWGWQSDANNGWFAYTNITGQGVLYNSSSMKAYIIHP